MRRRLAFITSLMLCTLGFAQTRMDFVRLADESFRDNDFAVAAALYQQALETTVSLQSKGEVAPYDIRPYIPPKAKPQSDSITIEAPLVVAPARTDSTSTGKETEDENYAYIVHQLAESYRHIHDYHNAELWYGKAVNLKFIYRTDQYWYGQMLMRNEKYVEASKVLDAYASDSTNVAYNKKAERDIFGCDIARNASGISKNILVEEMASINSGSASFGISYFRDSTSIVFSSSRAGNTADKKDPWQGMYSSDLYSSFLMNGQQWSSPQKVSPEVNSVLNDGAPSCSISKDRNQISLYFTRWSDDYKECAIYVSRYLFNKWLAPVRLNSNVNMSGYRSMQPSISTDGRTLYFVSDRKGGKGKLDVWACEINEDNEAGRPYNLGPRINTSEDEMTPFYNQEKSTLYFSTEGRVGFGGMDIFKSIGSDSVWRIPLNLGRPINSAKDDAYFVLTKNESDGFLSSERKKCTSCGTVSCFQNFQVKYVPIQITITGKVYNTETNKAIPNSLVTFNDMKKEEDGEMATYYVITDDSGEYSFAANPDMLLYMKAQKVRFFGQTDTLLINNIKETTNFTKDFYLTPIPEGDIVVPGIEYDYNKADLRPQSIVNLDKYLVKVLKINGNLHIELGSHSDERGKDEYNLKLSEARAKSVVDYLISQGIDAGRLTAKGYGETMPLVPNAKTEEEHQRNRRTAFKVVKADKLKAGGVQ